jgi:GAF domain
VRRRRTMSRKPAITQHGSTTKPKRDNAPTAARQGSFSVADLQGKLDARTKQLNEAIERENATAEVLRVISSSPGELEPVFRSLLASAMRICDARFGHLLLYENGRFLAAALHNAPPDYAKLWNEPVLAGPKTALGQLASSRRVYHLTDLTADEAYAERDPLRVATVELAGARTLLGVPMLREGELVGAIGDLPHRGAALRREGNCAGKEFCCPGGHRHRKRPPP